MLLPISQLDVSQCRPTSESRVSHLVGVLTQPNGEIEPILVRKDLRTVVDGGHRVEACKRLGYLNIGATVVTDNYDTDILTLSKE